MKVENSINTLYFGQKVPTNSMLRLGSGIYNFDDAKNFCLLFDNKFPGYIGYYKKARSIIDKIGNKNPQIKEVLNNLNSIVSNKEKMNEISKQVSKLGTEIDVSI